MSKAERTGVCLSGRPLNAGSTAASQNNKKDSVIRGGRTMKNMVMFSGSAHPALSLSIAQRLGIPLGQTVLKKFSNQETCVEIGESVRDMDVYIIQSFYHIGEGSSQGENGHAEREAGKNINDLFMELCILLHACKISSARKITAVLPIFPYSKQPNGPYDKVPCLPAANNVSICNGAAETPLGDPHGPGGHHYKLWRARNGKLMANLLMVSGADHIITLDLHDPQFQGFFNIPVDNLKCQPSLYYRWIMENIPDWKQAAIVSPDAGGAKRQADTRPRRLYMAPALLRAIAMAEALDVNFALIHKERKRMAGKNGQQETSLFSSTLTSPVLFSPSKSTADLLSPDCGTTDPPMTPPTSFACHNRILIGDVMNKPVIIIDDMADTCNTIIKAALVCLAHGASQIYAFVSHGIFSQNALEKIHASPIHQIIMSNSVPFLSNQSGPGLGKKLAKVKVLDIAPLFAEAIRRIHYGESVSFLFESNPVKTDA